MRGHRRRRATQKSPATPISPKGGSGTASISLSLLLHDAHWHRVVVASRTRRCRARHKRYRIYGTRHSTAYQSEGAGSEPWLGPNLTDRLQELQEQGQQSFLVAPIGFLMDHLEILYDLDLKAQEKAKEMGVVLSRTEMPNDDPLLVDMLAELVTDKIKESS